jgi:hypothetical protein
MRDVRLGNYSKVWKACKSYVILEFLMMSRSLHTPFAPGKVAGAWVCLIVVLMLWTPMLASAWAASGMACCAGNLCAAHGHAKTNFSGKSEGTMECEHSRGAGMAACTMSCCHEQSASLVSSTVYVLPEPAVISLPAETPRPTIAVKHEEILQVFAPPSPPPKAPVL